MKPQNLFFLPLIVGAALTLSNATQAHVLLEQSQASSDQAYKAILKIPHGCGNQPTVKVRVVLPEGFYAAQPQAKAGWIIDTINGEYENSYTHHGQTLTSGVKEVTWSGGELPSDLFDEFIVAGQIGSFHKETTLVFNSYQTCANGVELAWDQAPSGEHHQHGSKYPAPVLKVMAQEAEKAQSAMENHNDKHSDHSPHLQNDAATIGSLKISSPQIKAMIPGAKVAGGYLNIENSGDQSDRLISVTSSDADRVEIHEMTMENDVMKMRQLKDGLLLPASETTELRPGGYHLMFMKPVRLFAEGEHVPAVLEFEKAGKIKLDFIVTNAKGQASDHSHH